MIDLPVPADEFKPRLTATRNLLSQMGLPVALLMAPETHYWLSGYDTFLGATLPQALIVTQNDDPTLVVWGADVAIAHETSLVTDIRTYRFGVDQPAEMFAQVIREKVANVKQIGLDASTPAINYGFGLALKAALNEADLIDITNSFARLRAVKSPAELALMRKAGHYARTGLIAARQHARPGLTEIELAAEIESAMRRIGSDYASIPTEMTTGHRSLIGHGTPKYRILEAGDLVHVEIGGVERRYNCVGMQTFAVPGAAPKPAAQRLYDVALLCLRLGLTQLRPDIPAAAVEAPALEHLRQQGLGDEFKMRFGYGVGIGYPPSWLEPLKITRTSDDVLVPGMTFVLHACLLDPAEQIGVLVGGTYTLTEDGYELLSGAGDVELGN
ncbi:MAG: Xaa-Pro peptidase family protein [Chloroflexota bacterium]